LTVPFPLPLAPDVIVTQLKVSVAVQPQFVPDVTVTVAVPVPPSEEKVLDVGVTVKLHVPACVTVTVCPATVIVPVRLDADVFAVTV
jgi:hypothetical protein